MINPLVSVIIPNYNHARYLDERIQSVLNQTYQNFEVIILDDKSTDNSVEVINKYKDNPHITNIVVNKENSASTFKQWHKGFELAKGELIWIAESDDKCEKELLSTLIEFFENDPDCVLAYTESIMFKDDGTQLNSNQEINSEMLTGREFISTRMSWTCAIVNASSALFRKSVAMSIDNQYTEYHGAGDRLFWIEIAENGNVGIDYHPLNFFRIHDNNSTKRHYDEGINQKEDFKILNYIKEKNYITTKQYHKIKRDYARWNIYSTRLSPLYRKEVSNLWNLRFSDIVFIHYTILRDILIYKLSCLKKLI